MHFVYTLYAFFRKGYLEFGILRRGMLCGPVIWVFRTHFNKETVGAHLNSM